MANSLQELLLRVSGQQEYIVKELERLGRVDQELAREYAEVRSLVAGVEAEIREAGKWSGEERRKVDGRLETGDNTFKRLETKVAMLERLVKSFEQRLQDKQTTLRKKFIGKLVEAAAPMFVGLVFWLFYHFLLVGPKIAEILKQIHGGGHGP